MDAVSKSCALYLRKALSISSVAMIAGLQFGLRVEMYSGRRTLSGDMNLSLLYHVERVCMETDCYRMSETHWSGVRSDELEKQLSRAMGPRKREEEVEI